MLEQKRFFKLTIVFGWTDRNKIGSTKIIGLINQIILTKIWLFQSKNFLSVHDGSIIKQFFERAYFALFRQFHSNIIFGMSTLH